MAVDDSSEAGERALRSIKANVIFSDEIIA